MTTASAASEGAAAQTRRRAVATWGGDYRCEVATGDFVLVVDEPASVGGTDTGPQPTELFLASIASCFTLAVAYAAKKRSVELRDLSVTVTGTYDGPRFSALHISARIGCDEREVARLVATAERVCYVTNTLRATPDIVVEAHRSAN
jgi:putative redox protein